jgi:Endoribonuclease XendoU
MTSKQFHVVVFFRLLAVDDAIDKLHIIKRLKKLYDNFEFNSSIDETVTREEEAEEMEFIDSLLETAVMKFVIVRDFESTVVHACYLKTSET